MSGALFNAIKEYPDMIQIIVYKQPNKYPVQDGLKRRKERKEGNIDDNDYLTLDRSVRRSRAVIKDLIICNKFDYFCTFTFDPKKYDRYNFNHLKLVMTRWLNNQRRNGSPNLLYLIVPEFHKDGAIHFHGLLKNYNGSVKLSKKRTKGNYKIFNLPSFRGGFTTASPITENLDAVAEYVSKYITKEFISIYNKNRYFCSKQLIRPKHYHNRIINVSKLKNCELQYEQDYYQIFYAKKTVDNMNHLMLNSN